MGKKNVIVGQSGGPTAVINASLCGVIREGLKKAAILKPFTAWFMESKAFWRGGIWIWERNCLQRT